MSERVEKPMSTDFAQRLQDVLEGDRQWLRPQRIQHAKYMFNLADTAEDKQLWRAVIKANSY